MMGLVGGPGLSGLVVQTNTSLGELFPSTLEANSWGKKKKVNKFDIVSCDSSAQDIYH